MISFLSKRDVQIDVMSCIQPFPFFPVVGQLVQVGQIL